MPDGGREQCTCSLRPLHPSSSASFPIFPCTRYWGASCSLFCSPCLDACCSAVPNGCSASIHAHRVDERVLGPAEEHHGLLFRGEVRAVPGQLRCRFPIPHHVHKHERLSDDIPIPSPCGFFDPRGCVTCKTTRSTRRFSPSSPSKRSAIVSSRWSGASTSLSGMPLCACGESLRCV